MTTLFTFPMFLGRKNYSGGSSSLLSQVKKGYLSKSRGFRKGNPRRRTAANSSSISKVLIGIRWARKRYDSSTLLNESLRG